MTGRARATTMGKLAASLGVVFTLLGTAVARAGEPNENLGMAQSERSESAAEAGLPILRGKTAAEETGGAPATDKPSVTGVRFAAADGATRLLIEVSQPVRYETGRLAEDRSKNLPPRIYVDIFGARLAMRAKEPIVVDDPLLRQVRVAQFNQDTVRVVLDMASARSHSAFLLPEPYRVVIDIQAPTMADAPPPVAKSRPAPVPVARKKEPATMGIRKIVLDPGHGGRDPGAIGVAGLAEKDIVLAIAKKLAAKLQKEMGVQVVLTRKDDSFVRLEDRTAVANAENADLFVSLHMNASPNGEARGIETYYLDNTTDEASIRLAARENATSRKNLSDLQFILSDMTQNMKLEDSITLAHRLQGSLIGGMTKKMADVRDLGVKKALFFVLVGARMPSVLVEMFFITNKSEGRAMNQEMYQDAMVEALYEGIQKYAQTTIAAKTL